MLQVKLFQYDHHNVSKNQLESTFLNNLLYFFSNLPNVVGIGFDFNNNNLRTITEKASSIGLKPIILTGPKFIKLMENAFISGKKIIDIRFTINIDEEEQEELKQLLSESSCISPLISFIKGILESDNIFIKNISWYEGIDRPVKLSLYDSGILYVNDGMETLRKSDHVLSFAVAQ